MASGSLNITTSNIYVSGVLSFESTANASDNTSQVTATLRLSRTNTGYETYGSGSFNISIGDSSKSESGVYSFTYNSNTLCITHTAVIPHNADGTKTINIKVSGFVSSGNPNLSIPEQTLSAVLDTNARESDFTVSDGTFGVVQTAVISSASSDFTHTLEYTCLSQSGVLFNKTSSKSLSFSIPVSLVNKLTNSYFTRCSLKLSTYKDNTLIGSKIKEITLFVPDSADFYPSIESVTASVVSDYPSFSFVKNKSKAKIKINGAKGAYGSIITSYSISGHSLSSNLSEATSNTLTESGSLTYTATIRDSRGRTASKEVTINVSDYFSPKIDSVSAMRCLQNGNEDTSGTYAKILAKFSYASLDSKNILTANVTYLNKTETISNNVSKLIGTFELQNSYPIKIEISDSLGGYDSYTALLHTADAIISVNTSGNGVAIGKYSEKDNTLEVALDVDFENPEQVVQALGAAPITNLAQKTIWVGSWDEVATAIENEYKSLANFSVSFFGLNINGQSFILEVGKISNEYGYALLKRYGNNGTVIYQYSKYGGTWSAMTTVIQDGKSYVGNPSGTLPVANGGTGATSADAARLNLGIKQHISCSNTDFNTLKDPGTYYGYTGMTNAKFPNNISVLEVIVYSPDWIVQRQTDGISGQVWQRIFTYGNTWSHWFQVYTSNEMAWKKASVTFSSGSGSTSASGVKTSSTVIATRGDSAMSGGNYATVAADCNSNGTIKMGLSNTNSGTYVVNLWWSL